jgi:hypothetical protein
MRSNKPVAVGRIVMYVPTDEDLAIAAGNKTDRLPAVVVKTWEDTSYENDEINLKVFTDGPVDLWRTSVPYDQSDKQPGTWHWPEIK